jgi:hypothetical protein
MEKLNVGSSNRLPLLPIEMAKAILYHYHDPVTMVVLHDVELLRNYTMLKNEISKGYMAQIENYCNGGMTVADSPIVYVLEKIVELMEQERNSGKDNKLLLMLQEMHGARDYKKMLLDMVDKNGDNPF